MPISFPLQSPLPGSRHVLHGGDTVVFTLHASGPGTAWLRTTLGRAAIHRQEIVRHVEEDAPILARHWMDLPMPATDIEGEYRLEIPLCEVGRFESKAFFLPENDREPVWPEGDNTVIKVEPAEYCAGSSMYCAFVRQFGENRRAGCEKPGHAEAIQLLEKDGYTVIPRSGTFRDLISELDHIVVDLGFRIVQVLPVFPIPTTYAAMGQFGSPFAALDFDNVDAGMADFDRRTTPLDQFRELADEVHRREARLFLDIPINHTGWASWLQNHHPEWFCRDDERRFESPGAWGVTWEDLSKLDYTHKGLWRYIADVFLFWCRQGVDGFRCDAGYMVPLAVWEYVAAKVRLEYPNTVFFLEGLGGKKSVVAQLLDHGGLDWAYSELFQNYERAQVEEILRESIDYTRSHGLHVHFAETHDNNRLADTSATWARMRVGLAALTSDAGSFGITCGVEWFATEKIDVHRTRGMNWGAEPNMVAALHRLNAILAQHPAFWHGAQLEMIDGGPDNVLTLVRTSLDGHARVLVLINLDAEKGAVAQWTSHDFREPMHGEWEDLLTGDRIESAVVEGKVSLSLAPGQCLCLSEQAVPSAPDVGRACQQRLRAKALEVRSFLGVAVGDPEADAQVLVRDPEGFCESLTGSGMPRTVRWQWPCDRDRHVLCPRGSLLLVQGPYRFHFSIISDGLVLAAEYSIPLGEDGNFTLIPVPVPPKASDDGPCFVDVAMRVYAEEGTRREQAKLLVLSSGESAPKVPMQVGKAALAARKAYALCTNGRGGMVHVQGAWGAIRSQYDTLLGANPHPDFPTDRRMLFSRCRAWVVFRDYSRELTTDCLVRFCQGQTSHALQWEFRVPVGRGKHIGLEVKLWFPEGCNATILTFKRQFLNGDPDALGASRDLRIILRPDIEARGFHEKSKAYAGLEETWPQAVEPRPDGLTFIPDEVAALDVAIASGEFVSEPEWIYNVDHPIDAERGMDGSNDLFSPGYFHFEIKEGEESSLTARMQEPGDLPPAELDTFPESLSLLDAAKRAIRDFVVRRDDSLTVIAGYPWFLDWGRDTLICLRGMIAAGMRDESRDILSQFARFEKDGTLPNMIRGDDDSNRDTSDAQLWFCVAAADLAQALGDDAVLEPFRATLLSIGRHYRDGTPNGIVMDPESGLIFSPSHYTWMDTNHPAGTPREGYPIEIQALWFAALRLLSRIDSEGRWEVLAEKVRASIGTYFVREGQGFLSDCLHAHSPDGGARAAIADDHLRPNQLFALTLGAVDDPARQRSVLRACEALLIPGSIRSLADRPTEFALPIHRDGCLLNDPHAPYWPRYEGDEDTRRKPAYHNGTAWNWPFPSYAEALYLSYGDEAKHTAQAILHSALVPFTDGCIGQLPEIMDAAAPHRERGCGAQAWSATELYRVLHLLSLA